LQNDNLIELSGTLSFRDLLKFQYSQCYRRTWWIVLLMMLLSLAGVLLAALVVLLTSDWDLARRNGTPFLLVVLFWTYVVAVPYFGAKRQMKSNTALSSSIMFVFSPRGIQRTGMHVSSEISYQGLWAVRETKSSFLLYLSTASAIALPKRFFNDSGQENDWRVLVEQGISPKRITKAGFLGRWL
jgi:hypothetical protein